MSELGQYIFNGLMLGMIYAMVAVGFTLFFGVLDVIKFSHGDVLMVGAFAGLAGAYLSIEHTGMYVEGMTQGKGFIALAALIFGNWQPFGVVGAALLFGIFDAVSFRLVQNQALPYQFVQMMPYLLTLAVLAGLRGKTQPPAAAGQAWSRDET